MLAFIVLITAQGNLFAQRSVASPDQRIRVSIEKSANGKMAAAIFFNNRKVLTTEPVDFEFSTTMPSLRDHLRITAYSTRKVDQEWYPVLKRHEKVTDRFNELTIQLTEQLAPARSLQLIIRAYNDGIAFRVDFPKTSSGVDYLIKEENTDFVFETDNTCWVADHEKFISPQESFFYKKRFSDITGKTLVGLPLTMQVSGQCYASITEAGLTDYAGMYLKRAETRAGFLLRTVLAPATNGQGGKVVKKDRFQTPWRVILLGETPGKLVESELINNLNPPCAIEDPSWIKPGISAWDNWFSYDVKMDEPTIRKFIDLAAGMGWPYMIVDWQWYGAYNTVSADITKPASSIDMPSLLKYAEQKNVRLILWLYWTDVNRSDWESVCDQYEKWGVAGVKIDFMDRDDQEMVNWYERITKTAARHKLLVNFHGAYKPTGFGRTYPNQLTREGVMGNEWNKWSVMVTPEHICTLPFTRMLAGPMDFTPGVFENRSAASFRIESPTNSMVTRANTLAQFVVFDSPLTVACDHPDNYRGKTGEDFLKSVKTVWDDTKIIEGSVGEYIIAARRDRQDWFIGVLNNSQPRTRCLKFDFLRNGRYKMISYEDDPLTQGAVRKEVIVTKNTLINLVMRAGGGFAAHLTPVK